MAANKVIAATNPDGELARIACNGSMGDSGTNEENKAWALTDMFIDHVKQSIPDDSRENGTNIGLTALRMQATYEGASGMGWDFNDVWRIEDTESFPYLKFQTAPPVITQTLTGGDTQLSGQCVSGATVTVCTGGKRYETTATGNRWTLSVDPLISGDVVEIYAVAANKFPSFSIYPTVTYKGDGTKDNPYQVSSAAELRYMNTPGYYRLMNDIDLEAWISASSSQKGWEPVDGYNFTEFDGNGHTISGLWIKDYHNNAGLFDVIGQNATVKSLNVEVAEKGINGGDSAGAIAALNLGIISQCDISGGKIASHYDYAGGVAGISKGEISDCRTANEIYGSHAGGIAGCNYGKVLKSMALGKIRGSDVAGLVGINRTADSKLKGCVALNSEISGTFSALRVLASFSNGATAPAMDNLANKNVMVTLNNKPQIISDDPVNGKSITDEEAMSKTTYSSLEWDFDTVWDIDNGYTYPFFKRNRQAAESISLGIHECTITEGENVSLKVTVLPLNATNKNVKWTSENSEVATVDADGNVTAVAPGVTEIVASTTDGTDLQASCKITVNKKDIPVSEIALNINEWSGCVGESVTLRAIVSPEDATVKTVNWTSKDTEVATVDADGNVTAVAPGVTEIVASTTDGTDLQASCRITVNRTGAIESIISDNTEVEVYDISGILIYRGTLSEAKLTTGIYIVRYCARTIRLVI